MVTCRTCPCESWRRSEGWQAWARPVLNARGPNALVNGKSPGQPSKLNDVQRQAIADMIERGPITAVQGVVRWRLAATIHACSSRNLTGSAVNSLKYRS